MTYGLVAIVRNEAERIWPLLNSVRPHLASWTVVDTGSFDGTRDVVRSALDGIPGSLHRRDFVNFGQARSEAFALARGTADWLLALDADMTVEVDPDFEPDPAVDAYLVEMRDSGTSWRLPLVLRGDLRWESRGAAHEYTALPDRAYVGVATDAIRVSFPPTEATPIKRHWYAALLEEDLERRPDDPRTVFYLAQTYRELGDPRARELYERRAVMGGYDEERWYAAYRAALLTPWPARAAELMAAWEERPARLEPLYALVTELNRRDSHHAAYALASLPGPGPDGLFVEADVWRWGMAFERSIAAWWVGAHAESRALSDGLLADPALPPPIRAAVERNRALAEGDA